jgi:predicted HicB family RNase H-like nuclease
METKNINIRIPAALHAQLVELAAADDRNLTQIVIRLLRLAIWTREGK